MRSCVRIAIELPSDPTVRRKNFRPTPVSVVFCPTGTRCAALIRTKPHQAAPSRTKPHTSPLRGGSVTSSPVGLHRVLAPSGVLPQAAEKLDARPEIWPDEVRIAVERLNLDAASYRQLEQAHGGDGTAIRRAVLDIVKTRGKMQNPVTGSGGML